MIIQWEEYLKKNIASLEKSGCHDVGHFQVGNLALAVKLMRLEKWNMSSRTLDCGFSSAVSTNPDVVISRWYVCHSTGLRWASRWPTVTTSTGLSADVNLTLSRPSDGGKVQAWSWHTFDSCQSVNAHQDAITSIQVGGSLTSTACCQHWGCTLFSAVSLSIKPQTSSSVTAPPF